MKINQRIFCKRSEEIRTHSLKTKQKTKTKTKQQQQQQRKQKQKKASTEMKTLWLKEIFQYSCLIRIMYHVVFNGNHHN